MANVTRYSLIYKNRYGGVVTTISSWFKLEYAKNESDFGSLSIDVPDIYPDGFFEIDGRFELWRQVGAFDPYIELDTFWLIRLVRKKQSRGDKFVHILCHDATNIIDRRIVAYSCSSSYTTKNTNTDNMIRAIVRENFGTLATDTNRDISAWMDIEADTSPSVCPIIEKSFCRQKVLPLLQDICSESFNAGTYLAFDVVYNGLDKPIFKVFRGYRGVDRTGVTGSGTKFIFSTEAGNLSYATFARDHAEEYNYIYAGGSGKDDTRIIATAQNDTWINKSPINRREDFIDARDDDAIATVQSEANARLKEAGPKEVINGHIVQTKDSIYGLHYKFGDLVTVMHAGISMNVHIDSVNVIIHGNGDEEIKINTRNLDDSEY